MSNQNGLIADQIANLLINSGLIENSYIFYIVIMSVLEQKKNISDMRYYRSKASFLRQAGYLDKEGSTTSERQASRPVTLNYSHMPFDRRRLASQVANPRQNTNEDRK